MEFGVAVAVKARMVGDFEAPPGGFAEAQAAQYDALVQGVERGDEDAAAAAMLRLLQDLP